MIQTLEKTADHRVFRMGAAVVRVDYPPLASYVRTVFPSMKEVPACPQDDAEYHARAKSLGYQSADEMNREHDPLHSFLAAKLGRPWSPTLCAHCNRQRLAPSERDAEERMVLAFQRLLNDPSAEHEAMSPLVDAGLNLSDLRTEALGLLR